MISLRDIIKKVKNSNFKKRVGAFTEKHNTLLSMLLSLVLAVVIWGYCASYVSPTYKPKFEDIPVQYDVAGTKAEEYKLSIITMEEKNPTLNVTLIGNRTDLGGIQKEDVIAYVDYDTMLNDVGFQTLPVKVKLRDELKDIPFSIENQSIQTLDIELDRYNEEFFQVTEVDHQNITTPSSEKVTIAKDIEQITFSPGALKIKATTSALALLDHVRVVIDEEETIDQTKNYTDLTHYELIDKNGNKLSNEAYRVESAKFSVTIPVCYMRELPITVGIDKTGITNSSFDMDWLKTRLRIVSDKEYMLAGYGEDTKKITLRTFDVSKRAALESWDTFQVGTVPLSSISPDPEPGKQPKECTITVDPGEGFEDLSAIGSVKVYLHKQDPSKEDPDKADPEKPDLVTVKRTIGNEEIKPMYGLTDYDYTIVSGRTIITLVGPEEELAKISASDLRAVTVLYDAPLNPSGTFSEGVTVTLPEECTHVWVSPMPKVTIIPKAKETTPPADS